MLYLISACVECECCKTVTYFATLAALPQDCQACSMLFVVCSLTVSRNPFAPTLSPTPSQLPWLEPCTEDCPHSQGLCPNLPFVTSPTMRFCPRPAKLLLCMALSPYSPACPIWHFCFGLNNCPSAGPCFLLLTYLMTSALLLIDYMLPPSDLVSASGTCPRT